MAFAWGLIWGSFFNVCIYRIPAKKSIVAPPSHCYTCGAWVKWYDNIPLVSYLMLKGNCRSCGSWFSPRYFMIELLTGLLFLLTFLVFGFEWQTPFHMVFISLLIIGTFTDIDYFIIPDEITLGGTAFAVLATFVLGPHSFIADQLHLTLDIAEQFTFSWNRPELPSPLPHWMAGTFSLIGMAFGYSLLRGIGIMGRILFRKDAMGMGDVKLFAFLGAWLGPLYCLWILFISAFIGALFGMALLLAHKALGKDEFEQLELPAQPTVTSQWLTADSQVGSIKSEAINLPSDKHLVTESSNSTILLQFPRKTAKQLHHFPYGPYIAIAAILVLLLHKWIDEGVLKFFLIR